MRTFFALLAVFAMTASQALAFDHLTGPVGQVYFSIPFGAPTKQEAMPRLGFRFDYGPRPAFDDTGTRVPYSLVDLRLNLDGQTSLRLNGVDVGQLPRPLYAAEGEGLTAGGVVLITLAVVVLGGVLFFCIAGDDYYELCP